MAWPDSGTNEVVKSVGATGRDHSTIAAWEADTDEDCTAGWGAGDYASPCSPVGDCYDDADFDEQPYLYGATTDSTHYRRLTVHSGERHAGKTPDGVYIGAYITWLRDKFVVVEWLIATTGIQAAYYNPADSRSMVRNCVVNFIGIDHAGAGSERDYENCVAIRAGGTFAYATTLRNCTGYSTSTYNVAWCTTCTNVIGIGASTQDFFSCGGDYNISGDTSSPGANSVDNVAAGDIFVSTTPGSEDLHLKSDATAASGAGDDLSAYFTIDIDDDTRSDWDIGADEYTAGAPPSFVPYPHPLVDNMGGGVAA